MPFTSILQEYKVYLTSLHERAMECIIDNHEKAILLTASRLAQWAGVSEAAIVGLSQVLGVRRISGNAANAAGSSSVSPFRGDPYSLF